MVFVLLTFGQDSDEESQRFVQGMLIMVAWTLIFLLPMPFRLKKISATDECIILHEKGKEKRIDYKDMHWITKYDFSAPWFVTIKYLDRESGSLKKLAFIPGTMNASGSREDPMTAFIHTQIEDRNPSFRDIPQPSAKKNQLLLTLAGIPFLLLFLYLSGFFDQFL